MTDPALSFRVFDADPNSCGGCEWPEMSGSPDPEDYDDAEQLAEAVLDWAEGECQPEDDYSTGDRIYVIVWGADETIAAESSRVLDFEDEDDDDDDEDE